MIIVGNLRESKAYYNYICDVPLLVRPNPAIIGDIITFEIPKNFYIWENEISGGVKDCKENENGLYIQCIAETAGTYTWTVRLLNQEFIPCYSNNCFFDSTPYLYECQKSVNFTINKKITLPTVITLPPVETL